MGIYPFRVTYMVVTESYWQNGDDGILSFGFIRIIRRRRSSRVYWIGVLTSAMAV